MVNQSRACRRLLELATATSLIPPARTSRRFTSEHLEAEVLGDFAIFTWDAWVHSQLNWAEEDLFLILGEGGAEYKVDYLLRKDVRLGFGRSLKARLVKKRRFQLRVSTTAHYTPHVVLISEHEGRHQLSWGNLDWDAIRRDIRWKHGLDWAGEVELILKVFRHPEDSSGLPAQEDLHPGLADYALVAGRLRRTELALVAKADGRLLKRLFTVDFEPQETIATLAELAITTESFEPSFRLQREVQETDTVQLRANWEVNEATWRRVEKQIVKPAGLSWEQAEVVIRLFDVTAGSNPSEVRPEQRRPIFHADNWYFGQVEPGRDYQACLLVEEKESRRVLGTVILSEVVRVPARPEKVVLMPVDDWRIFAYWHLERDSLGRRLAERKGSADWERAGTCLRVFHDQDGSLHHQMGRDISFDAWNTDNWYVNVEPDKVWRVQPAAVLGGESEPITVISNPAQTGRLGAGNNPVSYRSLAGSIEHPTIRRLESAMNTADFSIGKLILHLHAHLPFIERRINYGTTGYWQPAGYPEEWFHEALRETYIPLVIAMDRLVEEGTDFKLSIDISPPLIAMMQSPLLQEEFLQYIEGMISLARAEVERTRRQAPHYTHTAWMHLDTFLRCKEAFLSYGCDLTRAFKKFQDAGKLEVSTCAATHAFLPFWTMYPEAVRGQVAVAVRDYERVFGRRPNGIWLPECAYVPGIERFIEDQGLSYFFSEARTVVDADSRVEFGAHAPVFVRGSNVAVFPRDPETGKQVWSGEEGYPGDPDYLEFHIRGGPLKYNRITDRRGGPKQPYNRDWALSKAASHAQHFMESRNFRFNYVRQWFWKKPLVCAPYDAELFGHHWYEGVDFIYYLLKKLYHNQNQTELTTPSHYLAEYPTNQEIWPCVSSWGDKSTFDKWMYGSVSWMYRHGHEAVEEMVRMANHARDHEPTGLGRRVLAQAARELLLSQNSDVAFVISNGHFVDRMKEMFFTSLENFWRLSTMYWELAAGRTPDEIALRNMEIGSPIFPEVDPLLYAFPGEATT